MNSFLLITTVSPKSFDFASPRHKLFKVFLNSLDLIKYSDFQVFLVGDESINQVENRPFLRKIISQKATKGERLTEVYQLLLTEGKKFDYMARLDDDDIISPSVLSEHANSDADLIADSFHTFYDVVSMKFAQQKRPWIANTAFHKWEHAMHIYDKENESGVGFDQDHCEVWIKYYQDKKIKFTAKNKPLYLRVLNPLSVTSRGQLYNIHNKKGNYIEYLRKFGTFKEPKGMIDFASSLKRLRELSDQFDIEISENFNEGIVKKLVKRVFKNGK